MTGSNSQYLQSTGTVQAVQTDDPLLVDAVLELETEIEESGEPPVEQGWGECCPWAEPLVCLGPRALLGLGK